MIRHYGNRQHAGPHGPASGGGQPFVTGSAPEPLTRPDDTLISFSSFFDEQLGQAGCSPLLTSSSTSLWQSSHKYSNSGIGVSHKLALKRKVPANADRPVAFSPHRLSAPGLPQRAGSGFVEAVRVLPWSVAEQVCGEPTDVTAESSSWHDRVTPSSATTSPTVRHEQPSPSRRRDVIRNTHRSETNLAGSAQKTATLPHSAPLAFGATAGIQ